MAAILICTNGTGAHFMAAISTLVVNRFMIPRAFSVWKPTTHPLERYISHDLIRICLSKQLNNSAMDAFKGATRTTFYQEPCTPQQTSSRPWTSMSKGMGHTHYIKRELEHARLAREEAARRRRPADIGIVRHASTKSTDNTSDNKPVVCGIVGGVGPMAGVKLHEKIIALTPTNGTDQDHVTVHHVSRSFGIGDRTEYLLSPLQYKMLNPAEGALQAFRALVGSAAETGIPTELVVGVPCNTFHAPLIWNVFESGVKECAAEHKEVSVTLINMVDATVEYILRTLHKTHNGIEKIGLLSTEGTKETKLYHDKFKAHGVEVICVPEAMQIDLTQALYDPTWGIKAQSSPVTNLAIETMHNCAEWLAQVGKVEGIILGCTEIPLALPATSSFGNWSIPLVDPVEVLASTFVDHAKRRSMKDRVRIHSS
jgi:aspartate racemase